MRTLPWPVVLLPAAVALVAGIAAGQVLTRADDPPVTPNPDTGLTDQQRDQEYSAGSTAADAANEAFVRSFEQSGRDPRNLERVGMMVFASLEAESLAEAAANADLVVAGSVADTLFSGGTLPRNTATVAIDEVLKGAAPPTVLVGQLGGPGTFQGREYLGEMEGDPLLLQGDRVLLFLRADAAAAPGAYRVLYGAGSYFLEAGAVRLAPANPEGARLAKLSADQLLAEARTRALATP